MSPNERPRTVRGSGANEKRGERLSRASVRHAGDVPPFQVMPPLSPEEYAALRADIAENGVRVPVVKDQHGRILDGHHRVAIAEELGITYRVDVVQCPDGDGQARDLAFGLNLKRRKLSREQVRELVAKEIGHDPGASDRAIGRRLGCDHKTVGAVRRELSGEIPHSRLVQVLAGEDYAPFEPHPVLARLPLVPVGEFEAIARSIRDAGLFLPIVLNHDRSVLVDGRIRYLACRAVSVQPHFRTLGPEYDDEATATGFILSSNLFRQSLTTGQRAMVEARCTALRAGGRTS